MSKVSRGLTRLLMGDPSSQDPLPHEKVDEIYRENIRCLIKRGAFTEPANRFRGAHFQSGTSSPEKEKWENIKTLWDGWGEEES